MSEISVIIPAHNEQDYLNRTIDNIFKTACGEIEVVVVLNGYDQDVDKRAVVLRCEKNLGERVAMNMAAHAAKSKYLLRIDAHCDISPEGWDLKMIEAMKPKSITVAVLAALDKNWNRLPGHWYGFCQLSPSMEEKWLEPNKRNTCKLIEKNMAFTGCGFMIARDFYWSFGGADESLPPMGAIGPEFALHGWLDGEGVYTRTDVMIGHIFDVGGYNNPGVIYARSMLREKYGERYAEISNEFGGVNTAKKTSIDENKRTIVIDREDEHVTRDKDGKVLKKHMEYFKYVYTDDGNGPTEEQIREEYAPQAKKVGEDLYYADQNGKLVKVA